MGGLGLGDLRFCGFGVFGVLVGVLEVFALQSWLGCCFDWVGVGLVLGGFGGLGGVGGFLRHVMLL